MPRRPGAKPLQPDDLMQAIRLGRGKIPSITAEVLAAASSKARVSSIALEALVSVAEVPGVPTSSQRAVVVKVLGA
jgi:hypothetical protein